jgi:hypothetical protein
MKFLVKQYKLLQQLPLLPIPLDLLSPLPHLLSRLPSPFPVLEMTLWLMIIPLAEPSAPALLSLFTMLLTTLSLIVVMPPVPLTQEFNSIMLTHRFPQSVFSALLALFTTQSQDLASAKLVSIRLVKQPPQMKLFVSPALPLSAKTATSPAETSATLVLQELPLMLHPTYVSVMLVSSRMELPVMPVLPVVPLVQPQVYV